MVGGGSTDNFSFGELPLKKKAFKAFKVNFILTISRRVTKSNKLTVEASCGLMKKKTRKKKRTNPTHGDT